MIDSVAWRPGRIIIAAVALLGVLVVEGLAQTGGGWVLLVPPRIAEQRALMKVYAASSAAEVRAAVDSLPDDQQAQLVSTVYRILAIPVAAARTEAMLEALQDVAAPVTKWRRIAAFESSAACERQRELALETFEQKASRVRTAYPDGEELSVEDWRLLEGLSACRQSRCVSESSFVAR